MNCSKRVFLILQQTPYILSRALDIVVKIKNADYSLQANIKWTEMKKKYWQEVKCDLGSSLKLTRSMVYQSFDLR